VSRSLEKFPAEIVSNLFAEIDLFSAGRGFTDDVCLAGMEVLNGRHYGGRKVASPLPALGFDFVPP
jgi:hypothetical protein